MAYELISSLRDSDNAKGKKSKGYFNADVSTVSYPTGLPILDYYLGYKVNVYDPDNKVIGSYNNIGIPDGCYIEFIGKPSTSKTSAAMWVAGNITRPFENSFVIHYDMERAIDSYTRVHDLTKFPMNIIRNKYVLRQEKFTLNDMKASIMEVWREKTENRAKYEYKPGRLNEFGEEITMLVPTVIIIDSIATISSGIDGKSIADYEEVATQTERMRLTAEIGRFFNEVLAVLREANIIIIAINQIKTNPGMGVPTASEMLYLKQGEALPGGRAPQFLAHILVKFIAVGSEKYEKDEDGFDGFGVNMALIKSRVGSDGKTMLSVFDKKRGPSMIRSSVRFLRDLGLVTGNKNAYRFTTDPDETKFTLKEMEKDFKEKPQLYKVMKDALIPILENELSALDPEEVELPDEEINFYNL